MVQNNSVGIARFRVSREALLEGLHRALKFVSRSATLPILSHVKIVAEEGALQISATDLDTWVDVTLRREVLVETPGVETFPAHALLDWLAAMGKGDDVVYFEGTRERRTVARCGFSTARFNGNDPEDFPARPGGSFDTPAVSLPSRLFVGGLRQVAFAAAKVDLRACLKGVHIEVGAGRLRMTTCDGYMLARMEENVGHEAGQVSWLLPAVYTERIAATFSGDEELRISQISKERLQIEGADARMGVSLITDEYPDVEPILVSAGTAVTVNLDTQAFIRTYRQLRTLSMASTGDSRPIRNQIAENGEIAAAARYLVGLNKSTWDGGGASAVIEAAASSGKAEVGLNSNMVLGALAQFGKASVTMTYRGQDAGVLFSSPELPLTYVIMPLQFRD